MDEPLRLVHHHAGYVRMTANAFVQPGSTAQHVAIARAAAEALPGFRSWSHDPKTGSVVVQYAPGEFEADDLLKHIAKVTGFRGVENALRHKVNREELVSAFVDGVQDVNRIANEATGGRADLRELVPVALAVTSVVSFVLNPDRGSRLPTWDSALWRSYRTFMHWHRKEVRTRERDESNSTEDKDGHAP